MRELVFVVIVSIRKKRLCLFQLFDHIDMDRVDCLDIMTDLVNCNKFRKEKEQAFCVYLNKYSSIIIVGIEDLEAL